MTAMLTHTTAQHVEGPLDDDHQQYGVLPWRIGRQGNLRILLITDRDGRDWGVPKGSPAQGRVPFMSAALDAFEEAGVIGDIDPRPLTDYGYSRLADDGSRLACRVTLFAMRVRGTLLQWKERNERQRRWFDAREAADRLANIELAGFIRQLTSHPRTLTDAAGRLAAAGPA